MQLSVSGHHINVSDSLKEYVKKRLSRLERHFDQITNVHVILQVKGKTEHTAEATVRAGGTEIFATASATDLYTAIDALLDKLDRQIIKHKEKLNNHRSHA